MLTFTFSRVESISPCWLPINLFTDFPRWLLRLLLVSRGHLCYTFCAPNYGKSRLIYPRSGPHAHTGCCSQPNEPIISNYPAKNKSKRAGESLGHAQRQVFTGAGAGVGVSEDQISPLEPIPPGPVLCGEAQHREHLSVGFGVVRTHYG